MELSKKILDATIKYFAKYYSGNLFIDHVNPANDFYRKEQKKADKYFELKNARKLENQLKKYFKQVQDYGDANFADYIFNETEHSIDLLKDVEKNIEIILKQGSITKVSEFDDSLIYLRFFSKSPERQHIIKRLMQILTDFNSKKKSQKSDQIQNQSEVIQEAISQHQKSKVTVEKIKDERRVLIFVSIFLEAGSTVIYCQESSNSDVHVSWQDDKNLLIEAQSSALALIKHTVIKSFENEITIHYQEKTRI